MRSESFSVTKLILFSIITICLFFVLLEGGLILMGVRAYTASRDPYLGFVQSIPLFVQRTDENGGIQFATAKNKLRFFNAQTFPLSKGKQTYRIFCVGGSTTYGRPYSDNTSFCGWLREFLKTADPETQWEVINAGGISYASYRVAALMEELSGYDPDLFVVYSGHNEFLERRTYTKILDRDPRLNELDAALSRTRTYSVMKSAIAAITEHDSREAKKKYQATGEVETLLDTSIGLSAYQRDDRLREQILRHYRYNLARMSTIARQAHAKVLFVTPASSLKDCSPFKSQHSPGFSAQGREQVATALARARGLIDNRDLRPALAMLREADTLDDRYAATSHALGETLFELGQHDQALAALRRARDEDVCPLRALSPMIEIVREVAKETGAALVDFVHLVDEKSNERYGHKAPGREFFFDHVHPTIEANRDLALAIFDVLRHLGVVKSPSSLEPAMIDSVARTVEKRTDKRARAKALRNLAKVLSWAGKIEEAGRLARESEALVEDDAETVFILGSAAMSEGRWEDAERYYRKAIDLEPHYAKAHNNLGLVLVKMERLEEAIEAYEAALTHEPNHANAHYNIANAYGRRQKLDLAIAHYREALRIAPQDADASFNLANAFFRDSQMEAAAYQYRYTLRLTPNDTDTLYLLGNTLVRLNRLDEARGYYKVLLDLTPQDSNTHFKLGLIEQESQRPVAARRHFEAALTNEPGRQDILEKLAELDAN